MLSGAAFSQAATRNTTRKGEGHSDGHFNVLAFHVFRRAGRRARPHGDVATLVWQPLRGLAFPRSTSRGGYGAAARCPRHAVGKRGFGEVARWFRPARAGLLHGTWHAHAALYVCNRPRRARPRL